MAEQSYEEHDAQVGPDRWERNTASQLRLLASIWHEGYYDQEDDTVEHYSIIIRNGVEEAAKHGKYEYTYYFEWMPEPEMLNELKTDLKEYLPDCLVNIVQKKEIELADKKHHPTEVYVYVDWSEDHHSLEYLEQKWNECKERYSGRKGKNE